ncbi:MAG: hypothetical protein ISS74_06715 [Planctomycetes bacterium]|nr:hypothetical protein [Planctomycetota bacterium]
MQRLPMVPIAFLAAAVLAWAVAGCGGSDEAGQADEGPQAAMLNILRTATASAGAEPTGQPTWYTPANLYDYIDGQAEEFLAAGFVLLGHSEVKAKGAAGRAYVEIDLYDMAGPTGVKKVMTEPPPDKTAEIAPGVQAYRDAGMCEFGAGRYYVRMTARFDTEGQKGLVEALARGVAEAALAE